MGRDLQQYFGQAPQAIMTMDILPGTDGVERMSKSTGNYIGVTEDPRDVYGKVMSVPDEVMMTYFRLLTNHHADEFARHGGRPGVGRRRPARPQGAPRARDHHAAARRRRPRPRRKSTSTGSSAATRPATTCRSSRSSPTTSRTAAVYLPKVMERWFGLTRSEGRRRIEQGGVSLDGEPVTSLAVPADQLAGRRLKAGKSAKAQGVIRAPTEPVRPRRAGPRADVLRRG